MTGVIAPTRFARDATRSTGRVAALADLYLWCARYFVREHVADRALWRELLSQLTAIWLHRFAHGPERRLSRTESVLERGTTTRVERPIELRRRGDRLRRRQ